MGRHLMNSKTSRILSINRNALRPMIAKRFENGRRIAGMTQVSAAVRLGYRNSSPLCKIEKGLAVPPPELFVRAAILYAVSADYLMGLSDFPERDAATIEHLAMMRCVREQLAEHSAEAARRIAAASGDSAALGAHLDTLQRAVGEVWKQVCAVPAPAQGQAAIMPPPLREAIETAVEVAEGAYDYLRRRKMLRAHEYFDEITPEIQYPLLLMFDQGQVGQAASQSHLIAEADAIQAQLFEATR